MYWEPIHNILESRFTVLVVNARYHHARWLRLFLDSRRAWLRLDFLPPCRPDLNPIERVGKLVRRLATHNECFPQLENLTAAVGVLKAEVRLPRSACMSF